MSSAKPDLRAALRARRAAVPADVAAAAGQAAAAHLLALPEVASARVVALYATAHAELPTEPAAQALRDRGVTIAYPRVVAGEWLLAFHRVDAAADLRADTFRVPAPGPSAPQVPIDELDVVVIPGLVFDEAGNRIGWGKGYYDATLNAHDGPFRVGFAFDFQILPTIPTGPSDAALDCMVTERGVRRWPARRGTPTP